MLSSLFPKTHALACEINYAFHPWKTRENAVAVRRTREKKRSSGRPYQSLRSTGRVHRHDAAMWSRCAKKACCREDLVFGGKGACDDDDEDDDDDLWNDRSKLAGITILFGARRSKKSAKGKNSWKNAPSSRSTCHEIAGLPEPRFKRSGVGLRDYALPALDGKLWFETHNICGSLQQTDDLENAVAEAIVGNHVLKQAGATHLFFAELDTKLMILVVAVEKHEHQGEADETTPTGDFESYPQGTRDEEAWSEEAVDTRGHHNDAEVDREEVCFEDTLIKRDEVGSVDWFRRYRCVVRNVGAQGFVKPGARIECSPVGATPCQQFCLS
nr:hypothetical protein CFP56_19555 [Quercus suber]